MAKTVISNRTYNLMSTLINKLQGLSAYDQYEKDLDGDEKALFQQIKADDERHAELLAAAIEKLAKQEGLK